MTIQAAERTGGVDAQSTTTNTGGPASYLLYTVYNAFYPGTKYR